MEALRIVLADARFALRLLFRAPTFAASLLGVLVAGIGATTAVFSIVQALLLRPLPYPHPEELVMIWKTYEPVAKEWPASLADVVDLRAENKTFEAIAASGWDAFSLSDGDRPAEYVGGADVSGDFFTVMGVRPLQGRLLGPDDDRVGSAPACVVSADLWRRRFAADPGLVGRVITLNSRPFTVAGIGPEGFRFGGPNGDRADVWIPVVHGDGYAERAAARGYNAYRVLGRRKAGVTNEQAQADMTAIAGRLGEQHGSWRHRGLWVVDLHDALVGAARESALVLFGAVVLVFLVVCANTASLLLARGATRRAEMAARSALGATRARLVAQLVTETAVVFLIGGAGGGIAAVWLVDFFATSVATQVWSANIAFGVDGAAFAFAVLASLVCGVAFGLGPALATSRIAPQAVLKETSAQAGVSRRQRVLRSTLVVAQVAMAFALLAGAGLSLRAYAVMASTPPGFDPEGLVVGKLVLPEAKYADDEHVARFYEDLLARLAKEPGAAAVTANSALPFFGSNQNGWFKIEGRPPWPDGKGPILERNVVLPGYFQALGIPILRGRELTADDRRDGRRVMVVSQRVAEQFFPGEDPIGRRIDLQDREGDVWWEIVGVAGDVRKNGLAKPPAAEAFVPLAQVPSRAMTIAVRSRTGEAMLARMRAAVQERDPELALFGHQTMKDKMAERNAERRSTALLLAAFAVAALVLSTMGLFGLVAYTTAQRTREIGIRTALGASPGELVGLVVGGGARIVGLGLVVGLVGATTLGRLLATHVAEVRGFDPLVFVTVSATLAAVGVLACFVPAWRAVRIPPSVALRYE